MWVSKGHDGSLGYLRSPPASNYFPPTNGKKENQTKQFIKLKESFPVHAGSYRILEVHAPLGTVFGHCSC